MSGSDTEGLQTLANDSDLMAGHLDDVASAADGLWGMENDLRSLLAAMDEVEIPPDRPGRALLASAFGAVRYRLQFRDGRTTFEPHLEFADGTTDPPRIAALPQEAIADWQRLRDAVLHPAWKSRLGHLLVASDRLVGRERVDVAADAARQYLLLPDDWGAGLDHVDALRAALGLTKQFGLAAQKNDVMQAVVEATDRSLSASDPKAGIVFGLTQMMVDDRNPPEDIDRLLTTSAAVFNGSIHQLDHVFHQRLVIAGADAARRNAVWADRVEAWLDAAEAESAGVRRAVFLQTAVEHSVSSGDPALRTKATSKLQELTLDDLGLMGMRTGLVLRGEEIAHAVKAVTDAPDWSRALDAFAVLGPPTGNAEENQKAAEEEAATFVFSNLFPMSRVGGDGLIRFTATTEEERAAYRLSEKETFQLQLRSGLVAEALLRIPHHHGEPSLEELGNHFGRSGVVGASLGFAIARSYQRWWAGDYEGAGFTAAARVETLARNLLLAVNAGIYRLQRDRSPGQYPGLGVLLAALREHGFDETWYRYLYTALASPTGWNLRNEMSHGFVDDLDLVLSAVLLQCAAHLALVPLFLVSSPDVAGAGVKTNDADDGGRGDPQGA